MKNVIAVDGGSETQTQSEELCARLSEVNWDFTIRLADPIDAIHPYPAKFIAEIPGTLLDEMPRPAGVVLDPFAGSGTTLVQCQKRGIASAGIDLNPIACLIARVKTSALPADAGEVLRTTLASARRKSADVPLIPRLDHWFEQPVQQHLSALIAAIGATRPDCQDFLRLALSSIIVRVSNQDSDTRYAAVKKVLPDNGVFGVFQNAAERLIRTLSQRTHMLVPAQVNQGNTLTFDWKSIGPVSAVITSPPYPNAYEYWLYHKYRMYWLGYDPIAVKNDEIGARAHFFTKNRHTKDHFVAQMDATFAAIASTLVQGGYAAFVVGRSKIHGEIIDNADIIEHVATKQGFRVEFRTERNIAPSRKSFNLAHAAIKTETLLVLTR